MAEIKSAANLVGNMYNRLIIIFHGVSLKLLKIKITAISYANLRLCGSMQRLSKGKINA